MGDGSNAGDQPPGGFDPDLPDDQILALQQGIGVSIMPVSDGWRVLYFSLPDFDEEPGKTFRALDAAVADVVRMLPKLNTEERREKARQELAKRLLERNRASRDGDSTE